MCVSGTKTGTSEQHVCSGGTCQLLPTPPACTPPDCNNQGTCSNTGKCVCDPGFNDATCAGQITSCTVDCAGLQRQGCVSNALCGDCLQGFSSVTGEANSACELALASMLSVAGAAQECCPVDHLFDNDYFSHWKGDFAIGAEVAVTATYAQPFTAVYYEIMSANSLPSEDPTHWVLEGSADGLKWQEMDSRENVVFTDRHQTLGFDVASCSPEPYTQYRLRVTGVRDLSTTAAVQLAEMDLFHFSANPSQCNARLTAFNSATTHTIVAAVMLPPEEGPTLLPRLDSQPNGPRVDHLPSTRRPPPT